jgi:hypothetical protein
MPIYTPVGGPNPNGYGPNVIITAIGSALDCGCGCGIPCCCGISPDSWVLGGTFPNGDCQDCSNFSGAIINRTEDCHWFVSVEHSCDGNPNFVDIDIEIGPVDEEGCWIVVRFGDEAEYRIELGSEDECLKEHTIPVYNINTTTCDWPNEITLTPG